MANQETADEIFVQTQRLVIRRFDEADAPALCAYRRDPEVARYQGWTEFSKEEARSFIAEIRAGEPGVRGRWYQFAVALREAPGLVGDIGLRVREDEPGTADIGYTLATAQQGRGLASEMVRAAIELAFTRWEVERVVATVDDRNARSLALARRVGMREVEAVATIWRGEACVERVFELRR